MPPPPRTWKDLQTHPFREGFRAAIIKEYHNLRRRNTFKPAPKTSKIATLPLIWIFTYKFDTDGYLLKFKARKITKKFHLEYMKPAHSPMHTDELVPYEGKATPPGSIRISTEGWILTICCYYH
jgi:hypothetical protein